MHLKNIIGVVAAFMGALAWAAPISSVDDAAAPDGMNQKRGCCWSEWTKGDDDPFEEAIAAAEADGKDDE
ncbi:uncharacterized protein RCC_11269 [Ramularia collo-cygni]|uniref:Pheromone n=1 Tax=Ramularia collo-cygni TaxID=112498 RepID=A0A2D3V7Z5_9PEZI|nr:uncharacterized protein RCC_11269 [Ramularia collo-cygni]CZT25536.1 uncharacterized protein RCC_11269 [Ramularia collo-cygni]